MLWKQNLNIYIRYLWTGAVCGEWLSFTLTEHWYFFSKALRDVQMGVIGWNEKERGKEREREKRAQSSARIETLCR